MKYGGGGRVGIINVPAEVEGPHEACCSVEELKRALGFKETKPTMGSHAKGSAKSYAKVVLTPCPVMKTQNRDKEMYLGCTDKITSKDKKMTTVEGP